MKGIRIGLIVALLFQTLFLPCVAQETIVLKSNEVNETSLKPGMYVEVTYTFAGKQTEAMGYIQSVRKRAFTVLDVSLRTIAYGDVITLQIKPVQKAPANALEGKWVRVTITTEPEKPLEGKLIAVSTDQLTLSRGNKRKYGAISRGMKLNHIAISRKNIETFEISMGYKRKTLKGLGVGFLTGLGITALSAATASNEGWPITERDATILAGVVLTPITCIVGGFIGFCIKKHIWQGVEVPKSALSLAPMQNRGIGAQVSIALR